MKTKSILASVLFVLAGLSGYSEIYMLDLDKSISVAKMKSFDMLSLKQDLKIAEYNLRYATSRLKTHVNMNLTTPEYTATIRQFEDTTGISFYPVRQMYYLGNLTINQPLPTDGNIFIRTALSNTEDLNDDKRLMNLNTRLGLTQPIDALYGYNNIRSSLKQAQLAYEQTQKQLKREELNLVYNVTSAYYSLLSVQKREEIAKMNLERQTEAFNIARNKHEAGLIREVDALQMEVDLAEAQNNYDLALINQGSALNYFKELIGINLADSVILDKNLDYTAVFVDRQKAVQLALENRLEIREQEIQIELNRMNIRRQKAEGMIKGDLTAYYEKVGVSKTDMNTGLNNSLESSMTDYINRPQNFGVGISISIPIIDWGENKALVRAAQARMQKNIYQQEEVRRGIEREVLDLVDEVSSSLKRLQLLEKNVAVAEKSFEITRLRFSDGDIDSQALALERERLNNAYISHLSSYINYRLQLADLMRKTFYDFQNDKPIL